MIPLGQGEGIPPHQRNFPIQNSFSRPSGFLPRRVAAISGPKLAIANILHVRFSAAPNPMLRTLAIFLMLSLAAHSQDRVVDLLKQLSEAPGVPGYEDAVRKLMAEQMRPLA